MLEATINGLSAGVYLLRRDSIIVYMNTAAEHQIKTGNALRITNNRLRPTNRAAGPALAQAINDALAVGGRSAMGDYSLAIPDGGHAGFVATVLSLPPEPKQSDPAAVAIFMQDLAATPLLLGKAFAKLYGLTPGELRVVLALAQGLGAKEAAETLGIGEPTIRTHLRHIFSKTSTTKQTELMSLLMRTVAPVRWN